MMVSRKPLLPQTSLPVKHNGFGNATSGSQTEELEHFIQEMTADLRDLENFYNVSFSTTRIERIGEYFARRANRVGEVIDSAFGGIMSLTWAPLSSL